MNNANDVKARAEQLYAKYINSAKESNRNNNLAQMDFFGGARKIFERNTIIAKLDVLAYVLGYSTQKVKDDIERTDSHA